MERSKKSLQRNDVNDGVTDLSEHVVVPVVSYNIAGIGNNGTIDEFVVVGVGLNQVETILRRYVLDIRAFNYRHDNGFCKRLSEKTLKNLGVFLNNLVTDAQRIIATNDGVPHGTEDAVAAYALDKAVGVENDTHRLLLSLFHSFLLMKPSVKVHPIDFIKALLVKFSRLPHLFRHLVESLCIVSGHELLDVIQLLSAFDMGKHLQKIELCWVKNSALYGIHNANHIESVCKVKTYF